jgi:hypothetical protein
MRTTTRANLLVYVTIAALAFVASATSLGNGYALDDVVLVADNARVHALHDWWRPFGQAYWPPQFGESLYRPIVTLGFALQWAAGNGAPWVFHITSVMLYVATCVLVLALFRLVLPFGPAAIAAALFAVHPVHVEAVANVVGQAELIAAVATCGAALLYVRHRRSGPLRPTSISGIAFLFAIACLAKEHALLLPALLIGLEAFALPQPAGPAHSLRSRVRALAPLYSTLTAVAVAYLVIRTLTLGEVLGERPLVPVHGAGRVWVMLAVVPHWIRLLFWPAKLSAEYSPQHVAIPTGLGLETLPGVAILLVTCLLFYALGGSSANNAGVRNAARAAVAWSAISLLPVSNLFSVMLVAERTLFVPSIGAMMLIGAGLWALSQRMSSPARRTGVRTVVAATTVALVVVGAMRSRDRQRIWRDDGTLFAQMVMDAPSSYRAQYFYGQLLFSQRRRAEGERHLRVAISLNPTPSDVSVLNYLATQYRDAGMCPQALPLYEQAIANDAQRPDVRYGLAACLLKTGRIADGRRVAEEGFRRGDLKGLFAQLIAHADSEPTLHR